MIANLKLTQIKNANTNTHSHICIVARIINRLQTHNINQKITNTIPVTEFSKTETPPKVDAEFYLQNMSKTVRWNART